MDIKGCHWLCGWKFVGKQKYVTEACYRVDTLFGGKELTPEELEWRQINQLFTMTRGGSRSSLDEMNEFEMQWNKRSRPCANFEIVCRQSRHVMISRACLFDTYGHRNDVTWAPSTEAGVASLALLLKQGNLWSSDQTSKRSLDINFWWGIFRPRKKIGSKKDQKQESVTEDAHIQHLFDILCST